MLVLSMAVILEAFGGHIYINFVSVDFHYGWDRTVFARFFSCCIRSCLYVSP